MEYPPSFTTQPTHKNTMKIIIAAILIILSDTASAGFLTGVIVGNALSGDSTPQSFSTPLLASDTNDVIICVKRTRINQCFVNVKINGVFKVGLTPIQYVKYSGYSELIKSAAIIHGEEQYIIMGVK